ncbi:hypothetical protein SAMN04489761_2241 [Tenacibaculum sp. MAR_2009_124]|uniref:hypothetical protein n=1 Tax=Tenacibaculum sp. MAR_2009_124 TaxID=1250059 RepID=UPI000898D43A|nr:hypothetical protein [Tenacibaculum sp. MAR_2009_124]SEC00998.1 hypothetical protein SAMN04489761_2241 [Tenacibaculum sp. MAR_2009_124]
MKNKQFDLAKFESLETSNDTLQGGFSTALSSTGGVSNIRVDLNLAKNCGSTNTGCNLVAGCGGSADTISA